MGQLILKRAPPPGGTEVLDRLTPEEATVVGRVTHSPTHGFEPTREAAMAALAKSWRRQ
jgi:hypothetical protein